MSITVVSSASPSNTPPAHASTPSDGPSSDFAALLRGHSSAPVSIDSSAANDKTDLPVADESSSLDTEKLAELAALLTGHLSGPASTQPTTTHDKPDLPAAEDSSLDAEKLAELAALDPTRATPALPLFLPPSLANSLSSPVDRNNDRNFSSAEKTRDTPSGLASGDASTNALLRDISAASAHVDGRLATEADTAKNFAANLATTSTQSNAGKIEFDTLSTNKIEPDALSFTKAAKIAVEQPGTPSTGQSFTAALSTANQASPPQAGEKPAASTTLATPLHDNRWTQDFGEKVVWLAKSDQHTAQININPPQLGPLQISLNLNGDQATAIFASPHAEVRQAIEDALPRLREMLSSAGISLGDANVGAQLPQQNRDTPSQFTNGNPNGTRFSGENAILGGEVNVSNKTGSLPIQRGRGLVDLFA